MKYSKIGVLTSGGDVPGLNAALHAIVLTASKKNITVIGINEGFEGLIDGHYTPLGVHEVRNIMDRGGTILHTSRSRRFEQRKWRKKAFEQLVKAEIEALIVIGGNGSMAGASAFASEFKIPVIGVPKTIDNDVYGTDFAIGFDTACNTIIDAIDKLKDTADSTSRVFVVEVMGRYAGFLALHSGIAVGADVVIVPEVEPDLNKMLSYLEHNWRVGNRAMILVITEHAIPEGGIGLKRILDAALPQLDSRLSILGHIQRGGRPSALDRTLASLFGYNAVIALTQGKKNIMVGNVAGKLKFTPLRAAAKKPHTIEAPLLRLVREFSFL